MKTVALGDVACFVRGVTFKPADVSKTSSPDLVGVLRTKNVQSELDLRDVVYIPRQLVTRDDQIVQTEDILISSANSWNLVGKCCWVPELATPYAVGGFIAGLRVASRDVHARYLYRWLSSPRIQALLRNTANQTTNIANLNLRRCEQLSVPLPPLDEQRRIAEILDHVEALRAKQCDVADLGAKLAQSIFLNTFGDPLQNPLCWPSGTLGDYAERVTDGEHKTPRRSDSGVPLLSARSVQSGWIDYQATDFVPDEEYEVLRRRIEPDIGDVLISCSGTIGRVAQVRNAAKFAMVRSVALVRPGHGLASGFLEALLSTPSMNALMNLRANSSAQANLFQNQIRALPVILPPLTLQKSFEQEVKSAQRHSALIRARSQPLDNLFASLQSRAFSGQL